MSKTPKNRGFSSVPDRELAAVKRAARALALKIQERRKEKGFTQESLAEALDISAVAIRHIEIGVRFPSLPMLIRIANKLGADIDLKPR